MMQLTGEFRPEDYICLIRNYDRKAVASGKLSPLDAIKMEQNVTLMLDLSSCISLNKCHNRNAAEMALADIRRSGTEALEQLKVLRGANGNAQTWQVSVDNIIKVYDDCTSVMAYLLNLYDSHLSKQFSVATQCPNLA